jgi:hypothetical protein
MDGPRGSSIRTSFSILAAKIKNALLPNMKAALGLFLGVLCAVSALAQGTIHFANTASTTLSTNSTATPPPGQPPFATGLTTGAGQYLIGLYIAPGGTSDPNAFTLLATTPNQTGVGNGRFDGGNVVFPNTGEFTAFQVRAWSAFGGSTFAQASSAPLAYLGTSTIGFVFSSAFSSEIFGSGPGQVAGFILTVPTPEPSTYALILLGLGTGFVFLKRQRQR